MLNWIVHQSEPDTVDRLSIRRRPSGWPIMYQSWQKILFIHWRIEEKYLRPLIPDGLTIDKYDGEAWIGVTPFTLSGVRPVLVPPLPWLSSFHELNVRTYIHLDGIPGVWFLSLDANRSIPALLARTFYYLPYMLADIELDQGKTTVDYALRRTQPRAPGAHFSATWIPEEHIGEAKPDSLAFFLVERYCLYTARGGRLYRGRIFHRPWPLQRATLGPFESSMIESHGLPTPQGDPLLHFSEGVDVEIWPLQSLA